MINMECQRLRSSYQFAGRAWLARVRALFMTALVFLPSAVVAQNYSWDARRIGMGGNTIAGSGNLAFTEIAAAPDDSHYKAFVIPLGLVQVLSHLDTFDVNKPNFDAIRAIDYIGNPFHITFDRSQDPGVEDIVRDIDNATLSRDLNTYRGFSPPSHLLAEGLVAPNWGHTFRFLKTDDGGFQGIYVGAGPYLSDRDQIDIDQSLVDILSSPVPVTVPANAVFHVTNAFAQQGAVAITGGYRSKFAFPSMGVGRDGVYVAANFSYLYGIHYDVLDLATQLQTDSSGLITTTPTGTPVAASYISATSGHGFTADLGVGIVRGPWDVGVGVNGIGNRINWSDVTVRQYAISNVTDGNGGFQETSKTPGADIRQTLPVRYAGNLGYHGNHWSVLADYTYGFQDNSFHAGSEYRFLMLTARGGARYTLGRWNPTGGLGFMLLPRLGIDAAVFPTDVNVNRAREISVALSLRLMSKPKG